MIRPSSPSTVTPTALAAVTTAALALGLRVARAFDEDDRAFALRAVKDAGVASIPVSALYEEDQVTTILRLCLAKNDQTLDEGVRRLAKARDLSRRA